jgi:hypothetical protein
VQLGLHNIDDELVSANHDGYIFHDSRGFEDGSEDELTIIREFVLRKSREKRLKNRLHAIWFAFLSLSIYVCKFTKLIFRFCIPMAKSDQPKLDLKHFENICPDENGMSNYDLMKFALTLGIFEVPVIAVFTKYDQFRFDIETKLVDQDRDAEIDRVFNQEYLAHLKGAPPYICLESEPRFGDCRNIYYLISLATDMHEAGTQCSALIELTSDALSGGAVSLMLLTVQRCNLELSINHAVRK